MCILTVKTFVRTPLTTPVCGDHTECKMCCKSFIYYAPIEDKTTIPELIEPIIYHLKIIAQDDYEFILQYFSHIIQFPNKKTKVNIVVAGKNGTGKNIIFDYFREKILGDKLSVQNR